MNNYNRRKTPVQFLNTQLFYTTLDCTINKQLFFWLKIFQWVMVMKLTRKLPHTSRVFSLYKFYSLLNDAMQYCESRLETRGLLTLEFDKSVFSYTTQPYTLHYTVNGKKRRYSPDILIRHTDNSFESIEIKPLKKLQSPKNTKKFSILQALYPRIMGHKLRLLSCADIYRGAKTNNLQHLYQYRQQPLNDAEINLYSKLPYSLTFGELTTVFNDSHTAFHSAMRLVAHDYFYWDVESSLTNNTLLTKEALQ